MAVRVKLRVRSGVNEIVSPALVNSGYESDVPELLLPEQVAEALGLHPGVRKAIVERYRVAGGSEIRLLRLKGAGEMEVVAEGRIGEGGEGGIKQPLPIMEHDPLPLGLVGES